MPENTQVSSTKTLPLIIGMIIVTEIFRLWNPLQLSGKTFRTFRSNFIMVV